MPHGYGYLQRLLEGRPLGKHFPIVFSVRVSSLTVSECSHPGVLCWCSLTAELFCEAGPPHAAGPPQLGLQASGPGQPVRQSCYPVQHRCHTPVCPVVSVTTVVQHNTPQLCNTTQPSCARVLRECGSGQNPELLLLSAVTHCWLYCAPATAPLCPLSIALKHDCRTELLFPGLSVPCYCNEF